MCHAAHCYDWTAGCRTNDLCERGICLMSYFVPGWVCRFVGCGMGLVDVGLPSPTPTWELSLWTRTAPVRGVNCTMQYRGGDLVAEETCQEKFSTPNSGAIFPITFNDCGRIFPILCFGHQVQNLYPVLGGGLIGGGGCRMKYVMWMDGLLRICVVYLATVNTAAMNTRLYLSGHFRLPTTCSCQLIVSAVSTDTVFSVGRCSAKAAAAQYLDEDVHIVLHIFFQTETCICTPTLTACNATFFGGLLFGAVS